MWIKDLKKLLSNEKLKDRIVFTLLLLIVCRIGAHIPVPGINTEKAVQMFQMATGGAQNLLQLMDVFSGGAFAHMTVIALGVMPYISASIVLQLLVAIIPSLQREMKESADSGKRKLGKWTRLATLALSVFQAGIFAKYAHQMNMSNPGIVLEHIARVQVAGFPWLFYLLFVSTMTAGTLFLMWVGEQITEKGVGNGISLIITIGILSSLPSILGTIYRGLNLESQEIGQMTFSGLVILSALFVFIIIGTILVIQGQRRIPLQYARKGADGEGKSSYIPLKINYAGVIPVIFASSVLMFPATILQFIGKGTWLADIAIYLSPGNWAHATLYVLLIIFFTYFWTATQFRPEQIASDMKRNGAFIPGIRQGKPTQDYLEASMNRITFGGALILALIAILPTLSGKVLGVDPTISHFFGGTSLLILVGVVLDTTKQIQSHMLNLNYSGFIKSPGLR